MANDMIHKPRGVANSLLKRTNRFATPQRPRRPKDTSDRGFQLKRKSSDSSDFEFDA